MRQELIVHNDTAVLRTKLARLGRAARQAHERARRCAIKAVENIVRAGQALCKARELCDTPEWEHFLTVDFGKTERTAQRYMKLARNWSQIQAVAPPEALTSQRQVFKLLDALLVGDQPPGEATAKKRAKRAVPALPAPEPASPPTAPADERWQLAAKKLQQHILRELEELTSQLREFSPPHYQVRNALDAIGRAYRHISEEGRMLFRAESAEGAATSESGSGCLQE